MINATISLEYLLIGGAALLFILWNPRIAFALLKVAFFLALYILAIPALYRWPDMEATREAHFLGSLAIPLGMMVLSSIIFAIAAYFIDRDFDKDPQDHFKGDTLFFRYGRSVFDTIIPIGLEGGATREEAETLKEQFREFLWNAANEQFGSLKGVSLKQKQIIKDLGWAREDSYHYRHGEKEFFRAAFQTARKSTLYYFVYCNLVGRQLLIHHYVYVRGRHFWHHALVFFATAPFHVWFWGYSWVKGRYSILGRLNRYPDRSSYDRIDLQSYFQSARFGMIAATRQFAKASGLLTEELDQVLLRKIDGPQSGDVFRKRSTLIDGALATCNQ